MSEEAKGAIPMQEAHPRTSPRQLRKRDANGSASTLQPRLAAFHELHGKDSWRYLADNDYIKTGYRVNHTVSDALASLFRVHNESINVWTHLIGAIAFGILLCLIALWAHLPGFDPEAGHHAHDSSAPARWPIAVFVASAMVCLAGSATFHLLHVVSRDLLDWLQSIDYGGIAILIAGSTVPIVEYGWACSPRIAATYIVACVAIAAVTAFVGGSKTFRSAAWRPLRVACFIATGCFGVVPWAHLRSTGQSVFREDTMPRLLVMGALYIGGALLYAARLPERLSKSGRFDVLLASHQIFHVCVLAACIVHYTTVLSIYEWRAANKCPE